MVCGRLSGGADHVNHRLGAFRQLANTIHRATDLRLGDFHQFYSGLFATQPVSGVCAQFTAHRGIDHFGIHAGSKLKFFNRGHSGTRIESLFVRLYSGSDSPEPHQTGAGRFERDLRCSFARYELYKKDSAIRTVTPRVDRSGATPSNEL